MEFCHINIAARQNLSVFSINVVMVFITAVLL